MIDGGQGDLFGPMTRHDELEQVALEFDEQHPRVWKLFCRFTWDRINKGFLNYSGTAIFERIRWQTDQAITPPVDWKLNNNLKAFYTRWWMDENPEFPGFFRTRRQISKDTDPVAPRPELGPADFPPE